MSEMQWTEADKQEMNEYADKVKAYLQKKEQITVSRMQTEFCIGYQKAARLLMMMEDAGILKCDLANDCKRYKLAQ